MADETKHPLIQKGAWGLGAAGLQGVMWALREAGVPLPWWLTPAVGVGSVVLLIISAVLLARPTWQWIKRYAAKLEPSHVIILGLVIALAGAIWQWARPKLIDPQIDELKSQIETLKKMPPPEVSAKPRSSNPLKNAIDDFLAKKGMTAVYDPFRGNVLMQDDADGRGPFIARWDKSLGDWPKISDGFTADQLRRYSPMLSVPWLPKGSAYDIGIKLPVFDGIIGILRDEMEPMTNECLRLQSNWWGRIVDPKNNKPYMPELLQFRDQIKANYEKLDAIRKKYPQYDDVVGLLDQGYYDQFLRDFEGFMVAVQTISTYMDFNAARHQYDSFNKLMKPFFDPLSKSLNQYRDWVATVKGIAIDRRRDLAG